MKGYRKYSNYIEANLLLDDINEIINQLLWYLFNLKQINDVEEFYVAIESIPTKITDIKRIIETELIENEGYFESQDES